MSYKSGVVDAIGVSKPRSKRRRVTVVECKRTRADLLQDLRAGKYLKYEQGTTHAYLAATREALALDKTSVGKAMDDLATRGFPKHWGILIIGPRGGVTCLRAAKQHKHVTTTTVRALVRKMARSMIYRALRNTL